MNLNIMDLEKDYQSCYKMFEFTMQKYLRASVETILKHLRSTCLAVYLIGSFGKDEGALYIENGSVMPLRDFDILVVSSKPIKPSAIEIITNEIHEKIGITPPTRRISPIEDFSIWVTSITLREILRGFPLLKFYELKIASKHLYGIDIRSWIPLELNDVSIYNSVLVLYSKVEGLLSLYPLTKGNYKRILNYVYEVLKTYTEVSTAFTILYKPMYKVKFVERCRSFCEEYKKMLPALFKYIPSLCSDMLKACVRRKLITKEFVENLDLHALSQEAVKTLDMILSVFANMAYGMKLPLEGFSKSDIKDVDKLGMITLTTFFQDYLSKVYEMNRRLARILSFTLTPIYLLTSNVRFFKRARMEGIPVNTRLIFSFKNHLMHLRYIGMVMLNALTSKDEKPVLEKVLPLLKHYLKPELIRELEQKPTVKLAGIVLTLLSRLIRLADVSLHRKAF